MANLISADEKRWQREDDARTLMQAEKIMQDKGRMEGAKQEAARMLTERENENKALKKVVGEGNTGAGSKPQNASRITTQPGIQWNKK